MPRGAGSTPGTWKTPELPERYGRKSWTQGENTKQSRQHIETVGLLPGKFDWPGVFPGAEGRLPSCAVWAGLCFKVIQSTGQVEHHSSHHGHYGSSKEHFGNRHEHYRSPYSSQRSADEDEEPAIKLNRRVSREGVITWHTIVVCEEEMHFTVPHQGGNVGEGNDVRFTLLW